MTSGAVSGTSGRRVPDWAVAYAILAVATVAIGAVNTMSVLDERSWMGRTVEWWRPAIWEATSGIVLLGLAWAPMLAVRRFPPAGPGWPRNLAIHLALTIPFSVVHVGLMVALRHAAYGLAGERYDFAGGWLYEYRKDIVSYVLYAGTFWLAARLGRGRDRAGPAAAAPVAILIDEGHRTIRVAATEVLAARACGNYVEFLLADGRRPLMRRTLAALHAELGTVGFVRTHRSWIVNPAHVAAIEAQGSGDHALTLGDGTSVPLSRRYRGALDALRRGG